MKATLPIIAFLLYTSISSAQILPQTPWTWMKGDNTIDQTGVYGTQCVANSSNKPGARNYSTTWRDTTGNLWLFGGLGYGISGMGYLNDLWKYTPATNNWTWIKGDNTIEQYSIYGTIGTANAANKPGAAYGSVSWTDANNSLWLFGGYGYTDNNFGFLNAIWKYNPATNQWTWVKGDKTIDKVGVYGTKGTAHANNKPGARYGCRTWIDASGNFWLYGGFGFGESGNGILNDLWKYNPATNQWTWISGDKTINQRGVYGTKGIAGSANKPGGRYLSSSWTDNSGNFWMFGGYGFDETSPGRLNDMWKYNPTTNEWTWVSGEKTVNQLGEYGTQGQPNMANKPGSRYISSSWTDAAGELWLFGGFGNDAASIGNLNDLWKFSPATNAWTWMKGDNIVDQPGIYGTQGMPDPTNKSGARTASVTWTDNNGNLWLFGGHGFDGSTEGELNDLWMITSLNMLLPLKLLDFNGVLNENTVRLQWLSEQETAFSHFNIQRSFDGINFNTIGSINGSGNSNRNNYSYADNDLQNRQQTKVFYRLQMIDKDGKTSFSKVLVFDLNQSTTTFTVFPNPAVHSINLSFTQEKKEEVSIFIRDIKGAIVKKQIQHMPAGRASTNIDVSSLPSGAYIIAVINGGKAVQQKFIKQ